MSQVAAQLANCKALEKDHENFVEEIRQGSNNIMVVVRSRPLSSKEVAKSSYETVKVLDERVAVLLDPGYELNPDDVLRKNRNKENQFAFDFVFDKYSTQKYIYESSVKLLISGFFDGLNGTVFAYGATGAGKTYTMIGTAEHPGIMERSMNEIFSLYSEVQSTNEVEVRVSYMEIYNETIKDLLTPGQRGLEIREDPAQGVTVSGISEFPASSTFEILHLLRLGNSNRTIESTGANEVSSRSHAVLQILLKMKERASGIQQQIKYSKLSLVDLAGSERASATNNRGIRLIEGAKINQSLLVLGNCIKALSEATNEKKGKGKINQFVQYRGSKLTRLLKDSLGGNCRTVMIANISVAQSSFEDTYNTLNFANRAKNIKTTVTRNFLAVDNHIANYAGLIEALKKENTQLKQQLRRNHINHTKEIILDEDDNTTLLREQQRMLEEMEQQARLQPPRISRALATEKKQQVTGGGRIAASPLRKREALEEKESSFHSTVNSQAEYEDSVDVSSEGIHLLQKKRSLSSKLEIAKLSRQNLERLVQSKNNAVGVAGTREKAQIDGPMSVEIEARDVESQQQKQLEMQVYFLKNQLKLRDNIIKDQSTLLTSNNIAFSPTISNNNPANSSSSPIHSESEEQVARLNSIETDLGVAGAHPTISKSPPPRLWGDLQPHIIDKSFAGTAKKFQQKTVNHQKIASGGEEIRKLDYSSDNKAKLVALNNKTNLDHRRYSRNITATEDSRHTRSPTKQQQQLPSPMLPPKRCTSLSYGGSKPSAQQRPSIALPLGSSLVPQAATAIKPSFVRRRLPSHNNALVGGAIVGTLPDIEKTFRSSTGSVYSHKSSIRQQQRTQEKRTASISSNTIIKNLPAPAGTSTNNHPPSYLTKDMHSYGNSFTIDDDFGNSSNSKFMNESPTINQSSPPPLHSFHLSNSIRSKDHQPLHPPGSYADYHKPYRCTNDSPSRQNRQVVGSSAAGHHVEHSSAASNHPLIQPSINPGNRSRLRSHYTLDTSIARKEQRLKQLNEYLKNTFNDDVVDINYKQNTGATTTTTTLSPQHSSSVSLQPSQIKKLRNILLEDGSRTNEQPPTQLTSRRINAANSNNNSLNLHYHSSTKHQRPTKLHSDLPN